MVTVLEECTTKEQCCCALFLWAEGLNAKDIHKEIFPVYGGKCLSRQAVHNWVETFSRGLLKVADDDRRGAVVAEVTVKKTCMLRVSTHW
jgi:hypothetical protein